MHTAELRFEYRSPRAAALVADAVAPELGELDDDRATATLDAAGSTVRVRVDAADLVALRAGMNTWGSLLEVASGVVEPEAGGNL